MIIPQEIWDKVEYILQYVVTWRGNIDLGGCQLCASVFQRRLSNHHSIPWLLQKCPLLRPTTCNSDNLTISPMPRWRFRTRTRPRANLWCSWDLCRTEISLQLGNISIVARAVRPTPICMMRSVSRTGLTKWIHTLWVHPLPLNSYSIQLLMEI
jgi:hypothetical protein